MKEVHSMDEAVFLQILNSLLEKAKKKKNELKKTEERITVIEDRLKAIEEESALPEVCTDTARLLELHKESTKLSEELDTLYEKWEELSE